MAKLLIWYARYMSQALSDLLANRNYDEPPEITFIKEYVFKYIKITPEVALNKETYIIKVPSAAAAGTLRTQIFDLQQQLEDSRRVVIRIG